ncbi:hypothetical protein [Sorangium sp. So ce381]|uniref:hypothetical protein n=1 Tax=unclassified Sorangium TaxID=2621164 RepID=UPI003F5B7D9E
MVRAGLPPRRAAAIARSLAGVFVSPSLRLEHGLANVAVGSGDPLDISTWAFCPVAPGERRRVT